MGNRAVITFRTASAAPAIYLHWNGGRASVEAFLEAARRLGLRWCPTDEDEGPTMDRLAEMIARHFFGCEVGLTVYRNPYGATDKDNKDNGTYKLTMDLHIERRVHFPGREERDEEKTRAIIEQITSRAPAFNF